MKYISKSKFFKDFFQEMVKVFNIEIHNFWGSEQFNKIIIILIPDYAMNILQYKYSKTLWLQQFNIAYLYILNNPNFSVFHEKLQQYTYVFEISCTNTNSQMLWLLKQTECVNHFANDPITHHFPIPTPPLQETQTLTTWHRMEDVEVDI